MALADDAEHERFKQKYGEDPALGEGDPRRPVRLSADYPPSMAAETETDPALQDAAWDLEPAARRRRRGGRRRPARRGSARAPTRSPSATPAASPSSTGPASSRRCDELVGIYELVGRAGYYAGLRFSTDTADPARGALLQKVQERGTAIETKLLFFDLEWAALDDARAEELLAADGLDFAATTCARRAATARTCSPSPRRSSSPRRRHRALGLGAPVLRADRRRSRSSSTATRLPLDVALAA